jgi:anti-sigma B factor antagonist
VSSLPVNLPEPKLALEHHEFPPAASVITLKGKLLLGQESAKLAALVPELIAAGHRNLIFDLHGVTHIDSTGIGRFIDAYSRLARIGGKMRLAGASGTVRDSFHVTRLDTVFSFYPTVEMACQGLS